MLTVQRYSAAHPPRFTRVEHNAGRVKDKVVIPSGGEFYFMGEPMNFDVQVS
jgi:hypothetical protein